MKTSSKISFKFTIFTIFIVLLFGIWANLIFFRSWYKVNWMQLKNPMEKHFQKRHILGRERGNLIERFPLRSHEAIEVLDNHIWGNISKVDGEYLLYTKINNSLLVIVVTQPVQAQKRFVLMSLYLVLFFGVLAYFLSLLFVKDSLRSLNLLVKHAQGLHLDALDKKIHIVGPDGDEIKILANTLNDSLKKIHNQANALKDFVANASHELKTPLMVMNSEIDIALRSKNYPNSLNKIKVNLKYVDDLLEQLLMITRLDSWDKLIKKNENISDLVKGVAKMVSSFYENKGIVLKKAIQWNVVKKVNSSSIEIIVKNLLDNAFKYSNKWSEVSLVFTDDSLIVSDTGIGIEKKNLDKIWERFWKFDPSRSDTKSFGLWLYLVKKLVEQHKWEISVESSKSWTKFIIIF